MIAACLPMRLVSVRNTREHWSAVSRREKKQKQALTWHLITKRKPVLPCIIRLTRIGPSKMDSDNAVEACKHIRDAVAKWLGIDDGRDDLVTWEYAREKGPFAVRVEVLNV